MYLKNLIRHAYAYDNFKSCGFEKMPIEWQKEFLKVIGVTEDKLEKGRWDGNRTKINKSKGA
jgi:hypothetical protein